MNRGTTFGYISKRNPLKRNSPYKYNEGYLFVNKRKTNTSQKEQSVKLIPGILYSITSFI